MLTPVRAASNTSFSSQGQTATSNSDGLIRAASAVAPVQQIESGDINSAIAGKLSILLLAVRVRMVEALLDILNAAGDALPLPRSDDETDLAFASRLAEVIQKLPPAKIEQVERQLAAQGHGVPLRLLAEALKNPAGPEAARIAAYLETMRYKDRDLAARAVVRSYGQNDSSPLRQDQRMEISVHRDNVPAAMQSTPTATNADKTETPARTTTVAAAYLGAELAEQPAVLTEMIAEAQESIGERATIPVGGQAEARAASVANGLLQVAKDEVLDTSIESVVIKNAGGVTEADAHPLAAKADPTIPRSWAGIPASLTDKAADLIVAIIRDQEAEVLLEATDVDPAVEIDVILDETLISNGLEALTRLPDGVAQIGVARQSVLLAQPQPAGAAAAAANKRPEVEPDLHPAMQDTIDAAHIPVLLTIVEGVPYATQPYRFAKDETEDRGSGDMYRQDHDSGPQPEEQDGQSESPSEQAAELTAEEEENDAPPSAEPRSETPQLPAPGLAMSAISEGAYALYQRMADWE